MGKLTIVHVAPYLPYGVKIKTGANVIRELVVDIPKDEEIKKYVPIQYVINGMGHSLILRPMSDLTKEEWLKVFRSCFSKEALEVMEQFNLDVYLKPNSGTVWLYDVDKGMSFIAPKDYFIAYSSNSKSIGFTRGYCFDTLNFFKELYKLHADIDGLIEKGLAIDINTLKREVK